VVAGATAVPQGFYRRFAEHAARRGFDVLTLDYRGIGQSAPPTLKGFRMNYLDWGRLDLAAAVEAMRLQGMPLYLVGHSYGGHALGLLPDPGAVHGAYTFATGAGWHGWMPPLERLRVLFMWRVLGPVWTRMHGYLPWSRLGMGEDLPIDVYRQWRHWCRFPRYFFDDPEMAATTERFGDVRFPIVAVNALDDAWAPPASRDAFMAGYRNAEVNNVTLDTRLGAIGHMGYFRAKAQPLWNDALDWFSGLSPQRAPQA
jgi:predicted alpha/beta hydrolase